MVNWNNAAILSRKLALKISFLGCVVCVKPNMISTAPSRNQLTIRVSLKELKGGYMDVSSR
jgi:hypothetical protein